MKKLLGLLDDNILRFSVAFAILFTALYPKLPSIGIAHTWVYIRLEDFLILLVSFIWFVQLVRKKISLPKPEGIVIAIYWIAGLISLIYCLLFLASHLVNFFPQIALLEYLRRIEYMILFFAGFSSVKKKNDVILYITTLGITLTLLTLYGFGQKFYTVMWSIAPTFFKHFPFCFPAFLTGNEEFAKGTPFCLNDLSRISSTFGGHYDLAAYLVFVIPIFIALFIIIRKWYLRTLLAILVVLALELLNFTSSRTSFAAYLIGAMSMLFLWKKKAWILPVLVVSVGVLFVLSNSTLQRFEKTIQQVQVVQVQPGVNPEIQKIISKTQQTQANKQPQSPPPGTVTVGTGVENELASGSGQVLTEAELKSLQEQNVNISTVSGAFLLKKAYALDISFTTRFQAEWPRDWKAFIGSPIFGTGYSSLTLASDNDYLRALGETGLVGTLAFFFIFIIFGVYIKKAIKSIKDPIIAAFIFGLVGGVIGLLINAALIDVFEASKVAEPLWILLGIGIGAAKLYQKETISYKKELLKLFTSNIMIIIYLLLLVLTAFVASINNFFVADDFTWLKWAATAIGSDLPKYFINAQGFFYRPLDKVIVYFLYMIFSFQPQGYHLFILLLHFIAATGVYFLAKKLTHNKLFGVLSAFLFVLHPVHGENIYWFSTISVELGSLFIIYMMLFYIAFREGKSLLSYLFAILFALLTFVSYEIFVIVPFVLLALDVLILKPKKSKKVYLSYLPFIILFILYFVIRSVSHAFSGGGDYSYHLSHILPNIAGNLFGYTGLFVGGLPFLAFYTYLREGLRTDWLYFSLVALLIIGYIIWMIRLYRGKIKKVLWQKEIQLFIFCCVFIVIALAPFLPLGNIAPRYLYLGSFGYILALVIILQALFTKWTRNAKQATTIVVILTVVLGSIYFVSDLTEQQQWEKSGVITKNILLYFRKNFSAFSPQTDLYFVNTPIQQNNTWVFPVGLSDGLWFIYRDKMPKVHQVATIHDALQAVKTNGNTDSFIFIFDQQENIKRIK